MNWNITKLDVVPSLDGLTNAVVAVHWECVAQDGEFVGKKGGICYLSPKTESFLAYAKLTKKQVLSWIWTCGVHQGFTESDVLKQIENQKNPPIINPALPWK